MDPNRRLLRNSKSNKRPPAAVSADTSPTTAARIARFAGPASSRAVGSGSLSGSKSSNSSSSTGRGANFVGPQTLYELKRQKSSDSSGALFGELDTTKEKRKGKDSNARLIKDAVDSVIKEATLLAKKESDVLETEVAAASLLAKGDVFKESHCFGASSTPAFGNSMSPFGSSSSPAFSASSSPAFGAFGQSSNSPFGFPSAFGQNNNANNNPFGAQTGGSIFGGTSTGVFGSSPAFGASSTPAFGALSSPAFGGTSVFRQECPFGGFGSHIIIPAYYMIPASSIPTFGSSPVPAFSVPFGIGSSPAFIQSASAFGSTPFGTATSTFGAPTFPFAGQATTPAFGQHVGSRTTPYAQTPEAADSDSSGCTVGKLGSISAMPAYKEISHEELKWVDYQSRDKGGPNPAGQYSGGNGMGSDTVVFNQSNASAGNSSTPSLNTSSMAFNLTTPSLSMPFQSAQPTQNPGGFGFPAPAGSQATTQPSLTTSATSLSTTQAQGSSTVGTSSQPVVATSTTTGLFKNP